MFRKRRSPDDFAREIEAHLEIETQRLIEEGLNADDARTAARRRFGNVTRVMERFHESRGLLWVDHLVADARASVRSLANYPVACAVAVVSLAGGIGATTAALTVRDVVFRKPPALYRAPEELSRVQVGSPDRPVMPRGSPVPGALVQIWRDSLAAPGVAAAASLGSREVRANDRTESFPVRSVTPEFFSVLGVRPGFGRTFSEEPPEGWGAPPAILSHRVAQMLFDGQPDVVGSVVWIENRSYLVIGIMPERFWFSSMDSPIWTSLGPMDLPAVAGLDVVIRRPPDVAPERLGELLQPGLDQYASRLPAGERQLRLKVSGIEGTPLGQSVSLALPWLLGASVFLTLLIACANVAILVIAQWTAREHEIAIRAALGGSRGRIMRLLVTESLMIAAAGGLLGVSAAFAVLGLMVERAGPSGRFFEFSIEPVILFQSAVIAILSGIVAGLGPALFETRRLQGNPMRAITSSERVRQRWRHTLVALEITVTVALLVVAATMIDGYRRSFRTDLGFRTERLVAIRVENGTGVQVARLLDLLGAMPGVASAAVSTGIPYAGSGPLQRVAADASGALTVMTERAAIGPTFFETLGVPLRAGRAFTDQDGGAGPIAIVNETLGGHLWPGGSPVGKRVWIRETAYDVVGVVADYRNSAFQNRDWDPKVYVPFPDRGNDVKSVRFLVRSSGDAVAVARALRREIPKSAAGDVVSSAYTLDEIIAVGGQEILVGTAPLVPLVATGMVLTAAGIYGVLAFAIARRSKELAVRVAIGATRRDLVRLVAAQSLRLVAIGTICGVGATYSLVRVMRASGGAGSFFDPGWTAFVVPAVVIVVVGALASWIPARRALTINPSTLLRMT